jgi:hypothetical protein
VARLITIKQETLTVIFHAYSDGLIISLELNPRFGCVRMLDNVIHALLHQAENINLSSLENDRQSIKLSHRSESLWRQRLSPAYL